MRIIIYIFFFNNNVDAKYQIISEHCNDCIAVASSNATATLKKIVDFMLNNISLASFKV